MSVEQRRALTSRLTILQVLVCVLFAALAVSFWVLQVVQHQKFQEMAENNHQRTLSLRAPRGVVFDRDLKPLVLNRQSLSISIVREHTKDMNRAIRNVSAVLRLDGAAGRAIVDRHKREPQYRPITIVQDATSAQVASVLARKLELPEIDVEPVPTRQYPEKVAAHLFGYVGEVNDAQVNDSEGLKSGDIVGQSGLEKVYNAMLMGEDGTRRVVVNSVGREIRTLEEDEPLEGKRLQLTVDYDIQKAIEEGFDQLGFNGAAVVLDPASGEVLGITSRPAYDPNAFAAGIDRATWAGLTGDADLPLNDRAIQGRYSQGRPSRWRWRRRRSKKGSLPRTSRSTVPGGPVFMGGLSSAGKRADTERSTFGTRLNSRATCTSIPWAT